MKVIGVSAIMTNNRCVICGAIVPEGTQVCPSCESEIDKTYNQTLLGDIRGVAVYKCNKCGNRIYGKGNYCRVCGVKVKEKNNE